MSTSMLSSMVVTSPRMVSAASGMVAATISNSFSEDCCSEEKDVEKLKTIIRGNIEDFHTTADNV